MQYKYMIKNIKLQYTYYKKKMSFKLYKIYYSENLLCY